MSAESAFHQARKERFDKIVKESAERMRQHLVGGNLYGFAIDVNDPEQALAAAWWAMDNANLMGRIEGGKRIAQVFG